MPKIKNILQSIRIEEYILFIFCLALFISYFILTGLQTDHKSFFENGFKNVALGVRYFSFVFIFIYFYIFYKLYLYIVNWLSPIIEKNILFKKVFLFLPNPFINTWSGIKKVFLNALVFLRPIVLVSIFFTGISLMLGSMAVQLKGQLVDNLMTKIDKSIFGFYPFFMFSNQDVFSGKAIFAFSFIWAFLLLGFIMGFVWIILYLMRNNNFFKEYIIAMVFAVVIALPLWFFYPVNSPQNTYLNNVYNKPIDYSLAGITDNYNPGRRIFDFHEKYGVEQGDIAPISTMPSMHAAWAVIIVYYLFWFSRRTIFFSLPWFFFSSFGTFYLAQHYFIDVLVSLPIAFFAIFSANILVKMEKKYYQNDRFDRYEEKMKIQIRDDLMKVPNMFRHFYSVFWAGKK